MPKFNKQDDDTIIEKNQETAPGLYFQTGEIQHGDYDSKDWQSLIKDYTEMKDGDSVASTSLEIIQYPLSTAESNVMPGIPGDEESEEAARYIDWCFDNLKDGFQYYKDHLLTAVQYGVCIHEKIIKKADQYISSTGKKLLTNRIIKLQPIMPETVCKWLFKGKTFELEAIEQEYREIDSGIKQVIIDANKLDIFTYNKTFGDPRGKSALRPARLSYNLKKGVMISTGTAIQRGAGIPAIGVKGNPGNESKKIQSIARSMQLGANSYISYDMDMMKVELLEPKNQSMSKDFLDYQDRQMFFNTMSEFLSAGIGSNGSRAATSEHKSPYELKVVNLLQLFEKHVQYLVDEMINISPFAKITPEKKPIFKLDVTTQADMSSVADQLQKILPLISKQPGDDDYIRSMFNFPVIEQEQKSGSNIEENIESDKEVLEEGQLCGCGDHTKTLSQRRDLHPAEFMLATADEELMKIKSISEQEIQKLMNRIIDDVANQLGENKNGKYELRFKREFETKMKKQYNSAYSRGSNDLSEEFRKLKSGVSIKVSLINNNTRIERAVNKLYQQIDNAIQDNLDNVTDKFIASRGGMKKHLQSFKDGFKGNRRQILTQVDGGYTKGRGEAIKQVESDIQFYLYSAILDANLCEVCAPYDGQILTSEEIKADPNLNLTGTNVNLSCLGLKGQGKCRCALAPFESKQGVVEA